MNEIWRDIPGYEGLYQVSDRGDVKSLDRYVQYPPTSTRKGYSKRINSRILVHDINDGYHYVQLFKEGQGTMYGVHRLVAMAFVANPNSKPAVNHKDRNKDNNSAGNLEWVTNKENTLHAKATGHDFGRSWRGKEMSYEHRAKLSFASSRKIAVKCIETGEVFRSLADAAERINMTSESIRNSIKNNVAICKHQFTFVVVDNSLKGD